MRRFLTIFSLVSRVPIKAAFEPDYSRADFWLPLVAPLASVAALAGLAIGHWLWKSAALAIVSALAFQYAAFNLFHLDGLLDSADAMLPFASKEKRLEILKDSRIGTYAFGVGVLCLGAKAIALVELAAFQDASASSAATAVAARATSLVGPGSIAAFLGAPVAGRAAAALVPLLSPPARPTGLGVLMRDFSALRLALGFSIALLPLGAWTLVTGQTAIGATAAIAAFLSAIGAGFFCARLYKSRVGGFTGDALGAAVELGELCAILALAALIPRLALA